VFGILTVDLQNSLHPFLALQHMVAAANFAVRLNTPTFRDTRCPG